MKELRLAGMRCAHVQPSLRALAVSHGVTVVGHVRGGALYARQGGGTIRTSGRGHYTNGRGTTRPASHYMQDHPAAGGPGGDQSRHHCPSHRKNSAQAAGRSPPPRPRPPRVRHAQAHPPSTRNAQAHPPRTRHAQAHRPHARAPAGGRRTANGARSSASPGRAGRHPRPAAAHSRAPLRRRTAAATQSHERWPRLPPPAGRAAAPAAGRARQRVRRRARAARCPALSRAATRHPAGGPA
mmetsp:Transcript_46646/g.117501  ORF Transcript_46646/g.117501 Transcript_46646/m.117501 type:complete len:240 (-) Transcript_46646:358-1077(-)